MEKIKQIQKHLVLALTHITPGSTRKSDHLNNLARSTVVRSIAGVLSIVRLGK